MDLSYVAFIETTLSYLYTWPGVGKELISKDAGISNIMKDKSTLSLSDYLAHPDCLRYYNMGFYPSATPTPKQLPPTTYNLFPWKQHRRLHFYAVPQWWHMYRRHQWLHMHMHKQIHIHRNVTAFVTQKRAVTPLQGCHSPQHSRGCEAAAN